MADVDKKFRFRKFPVYKDARKFVSDVKKFCRMHFPKNEEYSLLNQICRALNSILLNIAEGSDRSTDKDFASYLNKAHTSLNEVVACLDVAVDEGYIAEYDQVIFLNTAATLANQLTAFREDLLNNPKK